MSSLSYDDAINSLCSMFPRTPMPALHSALRRNRGEIGPTVEYLLAAPDVSDTLRLSQKSTPESRTAYSAGVGPRDSPAILVTRPSTQLIPPTSVDSYPKARPLMPTSSQGILPRSFTSAALPVPQLPLAELPRRRTAVLPFALWFNALHAWPGLRGEATRRLPDQSDRSKVKFYVGFGSVVDVQAASGDGSVHATLEIRFDGFDPVSSLRSPYASAESLRSALFDLANGGSSAADGCLSGYLSAIGARSAEELGIRTKHRTNKQTSCVSGGGTFSVGDVVAALVKSKVDRENTQSATALPTASKFSRDKLKLCKRSFDACRYKTACRFSHTDDEVREVQAALSSMSTLTTASRGSAPLRWFVEGVLRLQCAPASAPAAVSAWRTGSTVAPGGSLAAFAEAQMTPTFLKDLVTLMRRSRAPQAASYVNQAADSNLGDVFTALFSQSLTWTQLEIALGGAEADMAMFVLEAAVQTADERVLAAGASKLQCCVVAAASRPMSVDSVAALGSILATLASRLPARQKVTLESTSMRAMRSAAKRESADTPWLDVPLIPTVSDIQGGARWLGAGRLKGLETFYDSKNAYLERLFRLLRADALADMTLRVGVLARGEPVPDRELRRFTNLRVEGYRARGGALQVALSFCPVSKPRGGNCVTAKLLMDGSLVCIAPRGRWRDVASLLWAVVSPASGALECNVVVVEVLPDTGTDAIDVLRTLMAVPPGTSEMVENPEFFTAARFALERLKELGSGQDDAPVLPFADQLVYPQSSPAEGFYPIADDKKWRQCCDRELDFIFKIPALVSLNKEQHFSVRRGLQSAMWACQGPPGTGKTTASVAFFTALQSFSSLERSKSPVLMLSVKNHALDQFLERIKTAHPTIRLVRVGGKVATPALASANLFSLRKVAEEACREKRTVLPAVMNAWRDKCKAYAALRDAQDALADALAICIGGGGALDPFEVLATLSATQLRDLVLGARHGRIASGFSIPGFDLVTAWAHQAAEIGDSLRYVDNRADSLRAALDSAPSLVDTGALDFDALTMADVTVRKKGKASGMPKLKDIVLDALHLWASEAVGADVFDMFDAAQGTFDDDHEQLLRKPRTEEDASVAARDEATDGDADVDTILREARAAALLDDDDESDDVGSTFETVTKRRTTKPRKGIAGVIDALNMSRLGASGEAKQSDTQVVAALSAHEFVSRPLRPVFAELFSEVSSSIDETPLWDLTPRGRAFLLHRSAIALREAADIKFATALPAFREAARNDAEARAAFDAAVVGDARVIGMTINGAAKYTALLAALAPQVIIVEEAAEVKEPLLIAALPSSARLLFMAGDHEQLPPQPAYFPFTKPEFALDVSLFKRLIRARIAPGRLRQQNRMHPQLADVLRAVGAYGECGYVDGDHVLGLDRAAVHSVHGRLRGPFWLHAAFWWTHSDPEDDSGGSSYGHKNSSEALRVARAAAWHMANGVHPSRIVVLTGYAAQVALIRRELANKDNLPLVTVEDALASCPEGVDPAPLASVAAAKSGDAAAAAATATRSSIDRPRVCTIDEFQGDEADHIILSLVRGGSGRLGFMKHRERLVVAVSRARRSLLIVGHSTAFCRASPDWCNVYEHLVEIKAVGPALPLVCPRHPGSPPKYAPTAQEVPVIPSGMHCTRPCGENLHCGHSCTSSTCHSDTAHAATKCRRVISLPPERALCGHAPRAECWEFSLALPNLPACKSLCRSVMKCGHLCPRKCHLSSDRDHAAALHDCAVLVSYVYEQCGHTVDLECRQCNAASVALPPCSAPCSLKLPLPCGHSCAMSCGEICSASDDGGRCRVCLDIKETERLARVAARIEEARRAVELASINASRILTVDPEMRNLESDDPEYERIVNFVLRSVQSGHAISIRVSGIQKLDNTNALRSFWNAASDMHDPSSLDVTKLFHGTSSKNVKGIFNDGFRIRRARASPGAASHSRNMMGAAVYLCPDSSKAAREEYLGGHSGVLLLCDVLLGGIKEVGAADFELDDVRRRAEGRYDSALMRRTTEERKTDVCYDEYAVFDTRRVLPRYAIHVDVTLRAPCKDLVIRPTLQEGVSFYDISFSDLARLGINKPTSEAYHFFKAQGLFVQLTTNPAFSGLKLQKVTYCHNEILEKHFADAEATLKKRGLPCDVRYFFHGTAAANIDRILIGGFKLPGINVGHATDSGYWGKGIYLGVSTDVAVGYAKEKRMLLVAALNGRECPRNGDGRPYGGAGLTLEECSVDDEAVRKGRYQSYDAKNGEFIVASPWMTLPCYVVHWA